MDYSKPKPVDPAAPNDDEDGPTPGGPAFRKRRRGPAKKKPAQRATAAAATMVQIPIDALAAWTSSIDGIRKDLLSLQNKNSTDDSQKESTSKLHDALDRMQSELSTFQRQTSFPQFRRLPLELRRMVWGYAFSEPELFVFGDRACTRSHVNNILESCEEARREGESHLDYFISEIWSPVTLLLEPEKSNPKHYINLSVDNTIWLARSQGPVLPKNVHMHCGKCSGEPSRNTFWPPHILFCKETCPKFQRKSRCPIRKLAIQCSEWEKWWWGGRSLDPMGMYSMEILFQHHIEELILVLGDAPLTPHEGTTFVVPTISPACYAKATSDSRDLVNEESSWEEVVHKMVEQMEEYKRLLLSNEGNMINRVMETDYSPDVANAGDLDLEEVKRRYKDPDNIAEWKVPKIRFVEAKVQGTMEKWTVYRNEEELDGGNPVYAHSDLPWNVGLVAGDPRPERMFQHRLFPWVE